MPTLRTLLLLGLAASTSCVSIRADKFADLMQTPQTFERRLSKTVRLEYLLFLPESYRAKGDQRWPLILFLHGAGERGKNLRKVAAHGPPKIVAQRPDFPFIVVSPQCLEGDFWSPDALMALLDDVCATHAVDTTRVYVTGLSMGGFGAWTLGTLYPERFAAIAPICGGGMPVGVLLAEKEKAKALRTLGVWAFHGAKDNIVKPEESERMINAFRDKGAKDARLTVYPDAEHDSWTATYENPELYDWLLQHRRAKATR